MEPAFRACGQAQSTTLRASSSNGFHGVFMEPENKIALMGFQIFFPSHQDYLFATAALSWWTVAIRVGKHVNDVSH